MHEASISVSNLSKCYTIKHRSGSRDGLRHAIEEAIRNPIGWIKNQHKQIASSSEEFWAVKKLSLTINRGEVVGVIGRNGAGKSTFLKLLSRIIEPTSGEITLNGRVASLLEVGTGFHPELTGRENIYLNGAILGMKRTEINSKFDAIVEFAEIERFLDTPVKRYSSGMYVRLAFAVAAHLEPEILIADEVLAVGDTQFQDKCLKKMGEISSTDGRTILFVSHNLEAIRALTKRCLVLSAGELVFDGPTEKAVTVYNEKFGVHQDSGPYISPLSGKSRTLYIDKVEVTTSEPSFQQKSGAPLRVRIELVTRIPTTSLWLSFKVWNKSGSAMTFVCYQHPERKYPHHQLGNLSAGNHVFECQIDCFNAYMGAHTLSVDLWSPDTDMIEQLNGICNFDVFIPYDYVSRTDWPNALCAFLVKNEWSSQTRPLIS